MITASINRLSNIIQFAPPRLSKISEEIMSEKPSPGKWSKKEILGHLIDSATNNHQRFVRAQFELCPEISYNPDLWVLFSYYQQMESQQLISFWTIYNRQLLELIKSIPAENMARHVKAGDSVQSLAFLITDYVQHLEHHLKQIIDYAE